jgi:CheY-like chemotaxis protein
MPDGGRLTIATAGIRVGSGEKSVSGEILPGDYVRLSVTDTGCGIRPEELDRIFDPFFTTKDDGKGTGLGLSMVFGIVQQHEGFITVASTPGHGATFSILFPECGAGTSIACPAPCLPRDEERGHGTILVGEDNEDVRPMIVELLHDVGYRVLEARDGAEVVARMEQSGETVDLLLLDVIMPRMNGYEALSIVRERYPELPCLFLSGYSDDILKRKAKNSGEFACLSKPIMPDKLIAAVKAALAARRTMPIS